MFDEQEKLINIVKPYLPLNVLRDFLIQLDKVETESKRDILNYARKQKDYLTNGTNTKNNCKRCF